MNVARVEALVAAGRMRPPGLAAVEAAKADGRWEAAYESQRNATVPLDLAAALDHDDRAKAAFESLGRSERYAVILPLLHGAAPTGAPGPAAITRYQGRGLARPTSSRPLPGGRCI